jgi:hypothetical protein
MWQRLCEHDTTARNVPGSWVCGLLHHQQLFRGRREIQRLFRRCVQVAISSQVNMLHPALSAVAASAGGVAALLGTIAMARWQATILWIRLRTASTRATVVVCSSPSQSFLPCEHTPRPGWYRQNLITNAHPDPSPQVRGSDQVCRPQRRLWHLRRALLRGPRSPMAARRARHVLLPEKQASEGGEMPSLPHVDIHGRVSCVLAHKQHGRA